MQLVIFAVFISSVSTVTGLSRYRTWYPTNSKVSHRPLVSVKQSGAIQSIIQQSNKVPEISHRNLHSSHYPE